MKNNKKMTVNEFKNALSEAGMDFEFWGYEGILNLIAMANNYQAKELSEIKGMELIADEANERSMKLTQILQDRGYYS